MRLLSRPLLALLAGCSVPPAGVFDAAYQNTLPQLGLLPTAVAGGSLRSTPTLMRMSSLLSGSDGPACTTRTRRDRSLSLPATQSDG